MYKQINNCKTTKQIKMHTYNSKQPRQCGRQNGRHNQPKQPKNRVKTDSDQSQRISFDLSTLRIRTIRMRNQWIQQRCVVKK